MAETSTQEIMLGRYHAREVTLAQLQRRRLEAAEKLTAARKEMKATKSAAPLEEEGKAAHTAWLVKIGEHSNKIDKLAAETARDNVAIEQATVYGLLPADPGRPWEERAARAQASGEVPTRTEFRVEAVGVLNPVQHPDDLRTELRTPFSLVIPRRRAA